MPEKTVQKEPGKKPAPSKKPKPQQEVVVQIPLSELHPFPDHPFQVREDASMQETAESVKEYGVLVPALARPREDGGYELIAGHRRKHACELAGLTTMPVIAALNWTTSPQSLVVAGFNGIHICALCESVLTSSFCQVIFLFLPRSKPLLQG